MFYIIFTIILSFATAVFQFLWQDGLSVIVSYGVVVPFLVLIPRFVLKLSPKFKSAVGKDWLKKVEPIVFFIILVNAPASLFIHDMAVQYDRFLHFAVGSFLPVLFFAGIVPMFRLKNLNINRFVMFLLVLMITFSGLFMFEGLQFTIDNIFGTQLFHDTTQSKEVDFWEDIFFGSTGVIIGLMHFYRKNGNF